MTSVGDLYIDPSSNGRVYIEDTTPCGQWIYVCREDAAALWPILKHFAETGRLPEDKEGEG
jgi:hypothetical protein